MSFRDLLLDSMGRVKVFNKIEIIPVLAAFSWGVYAAWHDSFTLVTLAIILAGIFLSGYMMFLRAISFLVGVVSMVSAFMPILKMLKENERG